MRDLVVACADFAGLSLEQLRARAEASALGEDLQESTANQSTAASPLSILAAREPKQDLRNQCLNVVRTAIGHGALETTYEMRLCRSVEPKTECKIPCRLGRGGQGC